MNLAGIFANSKLSSVLNMQGFGSLTFFKDFANSQANMNADTSVGVATGTLTSARSVTVPATYFDASGAMQTVTTANTPRWTQGFYDAFGWHARPGLWVERVTTANQLVQSNAFTDVAYTATNITVADGVVLAGSPAATVSTLTGTAANGTLTQAFVDAVAGIYYAAIFVKRKTGTGTISLRANAGNSYTDLTAFVRSDRWTRISVRSTSLTNPTFDLKIVTSGDELYVCCADLVKLAHITSHIPTTTVGLIRAAERPSWPILNNRTALAESIFIKFTPTGSGFLGEGFFNDSLTRTLCDTDTKQRLIQKSTSGTVFRFSPNATDSALSLAIGLMPVPDGISVIFAGTCGHVTPYANQFYDGALETADTDDFTDPAWGTNFYIGCERTGANQIDGIIEAAAFFSTAKSDADVLTISTQLNKIATTDTYLPIGLANFIAGALAGSSLATPSYMWAPVMKKVGAQIKAYWRADSDIAATDTAPSGNLFLTEYDIAAETWSSPITIYDAGSGYAAEHLVEVRTAEIWIYFMLFTSRASILTGDVVLIKSTDGLVGHAFGAPQVIRSGVSYQECGSLIATGDSNVLRLIQASASGFFVTDVSATTGLALSATVTLAAGIAVAESAFVPIGAGKVVGLVRTTAGGYLFQATSADYMATCTVAFSTGIGASSANAKVRPRIQLAAGRTDYLIASFIDRGDSNRLKLLGPALCDDAYNNKWPAVYRFSGAVSTQGNGDFCTMDDETKRYLILEPAALAAPPANNNTFSWVMQDLLG